MSAREGGNSGVEKMLLGPSDFSSLGYRLRRKLCWFYSETLVYRRTKLKGWFSLQVYSRLYPNFHVGSNAKIWGWFQVTMHAPFESQVLLGDNLHMVSDRSRAGITLFSPCKFTTFGKGSIVVGDNVQLNGTAIASRKRVEIGAGSLVAPNCIIVDSDFHVIWPPESRGHSDSTKEDQAVKIGNNVWLGLNVVVLKGVTIGDNTIIGAGSVVSGDIPANVIAAGAPARVVRELTGAAL
jgi:acetyltransferase-like isoleucine patch superfamily enzyme